MTTFGKIEFQRKPDFTITNELPIAAQELMELLSNFNYRKHWVEDVEFQFDSSQVNRIGTEHVCVIKDKHLNFTTITKNGKPGQLVYGEMTKSPPPVDELYQFYTIKKVSDNQSKLIVEVYWKAKSPIKKVILKINIVQPYKNHELEHLNLHLSKFGINFQL